ncbi:hypothetical protein EV643_108312 [Kribbella sp. VKM Ac-2527]|jgi:hypothetical protein|uniref:Uncharacterized protein n=1 Tax=Kribbella caucasensis TaxID=2512215 RepID=A0A4R6KGD9_9ACTN|nr:hypothetical protein [Kribbella sp. VKM Ac-2527]TDO47995.1 hypothetical protein EV643_108312 [Kribbella sp. VKM Ac-2527]
MELPETADQLVLALDMTTGTAPEFPIVEAGRWLLATGTLP